MRLTSWANNDNYLVHIFQVQGVKITLKKFWKKEYFLIQQQFRENFVFLPNFLTVFVWTRLNVRLGKRKVALEKSLEWLKVLLDRAATKVQHNFKKYVFELLNWIQAVKKSRDYIAVKVLFEKYLQDIFERPWVK